MTTFYHKDQYFDAVEVDNRCLFRKSCETNNFIHLTFDYYCNYIPVHLSQVISSLQGF